MVSEADCESRIPLRFSALDERLERSHGKLLLYLFLGALAVRVLYLSQYAGSPFFWVPALDSLFHDLHARAIAAGRGVDGAYFRAPLYYYFLAGIYKVFGHSFWAARGIQAALGSASCVLLYLCGRRLFRPLVAVLAASAMAIYGPLVFFDGELLTPVLEIFLDLLFLLFLLRALGREGESRTEWLLAGLFLGLSAITRPNVLVALPLVLAWLGVRAPTPESSGIGVPESLRDAPRRRCAGKAGPGFRGGVGGHAALFLAAALLAPALVTLRNWRVSGDPVFIASQGGINLYLGNRSDADGFTPSTPARYRFAGPYEDSVALFGQRAAEEALGRPLSASRAQSYWTGQAVLWWRRHPHEALALTWKKWVLAWTHGEIRNNHAFAFFRKEVAPLLALLPVGFWIAGPLGLLGALLAWRERPASRILALFSLLYVASFVAFFVADRYRLPVVPALLLFGAYAAVWLAERVSGREWRPLLPVALALAAFALFVNVDWYRTVTPATWAADYWSAGNRCQALGRLAQAEAEYRRALSLDPANAEIWTNLGAAQYYQGRASEAEQSFQRSIRLSPASGGAYYNLAMCELTLSRRESARRLLEAALRLDPKHPGARAELAQLARAR